MKSIITLFIICLTINAFAKTENDIRNLTPNIMLDGLEESDIPAPILTAAQSLGEEESITYQTADAGIICLSIVVAGAVACGLHHIKSGDRATTVQKDTLDTMRRLALEKLK